MRNWLRKLQPSEDAVKTEVASVVKDIIGKSLAFGPRLGI
jgi:hypothetical protein